MAKTGSSTATMITRSVYLGRLRRAFLLRVHPDRYASRHSLVTKERQAALVKALANRMAQADFVAWQQQQQDTTSSLLRTKRYDGEDSSNSKMETAAAAGNGVYPYVLEKRNGTFLKASLSLGKHSSVDEILNSMATALQQSGAALPPKPKEQRRHKNSSSTVVRENGKFTTSTTTAATNSMDVDHFDRYNVQSNQGRDLWRFLGANQHHDNNNNLSNVILQRKHERLDAQAVAAQVRRVFLFAAVDATTLGWSSASVTVLLRRLLDLHQEFGHHHNKFHVDSFYPMRLVFSSRDVPDNHGDALDVYGGILRLNPASTPIQWLETLQLVDAHTIHQVKEYRDLLVTRTKQGQGILGGVKLKKGHTCSNRNYHAFLERLVRADKTTSDTSSAGINTFVPVAEPVQAVVEAESACRRARVTKDGHIQFSSNMTRYDCLDAVHRLAGTAREKAAADQRQRSQCKKAVHDVQWRLGLQKVYRTGIVSHQEFLDCLTRIMLLMMQQETRKSRLHALTGNSLGIAGTGHFCHLADDGSVVIPHNWR